MRRIKVRGGRLRKTRSRNFCAICPEMPELSDISPNGDDNLERLSKHLSQLNIKKPKLSSYGSSLLFSSKTVLGENIKESSNTKRKKKNYIKF